MGCNSIADYLLHVFRIVLESWLSFACSNQTLTFYFCLVVGQLQSQNLKLTLGLSGLVLDNEPSSPDPAARNAPNEIRTSPKPLGSFIPTTWSRDGLVRKWLSGTVQSCNLVISLIWVWDCNKQNTHKLNFSLITLYSIE